MSIARYIKAQLGLRHTVIYTDINGKYFRYFGGTLAWRNHNPGNIRPGEISERHNQIGVIHDFAIFPDYQSGHDALIDVIKTNYWNSSITQMIQHFAPSSENNTKRYIKFLQKFTGVSDDTKIKNFSAAKFKKLWEGIEKFESYRRGNVAQVYKITITQIDKKHDICAYFLENNKWINKTRCISLVRRNQLELEICSSRLGNLYLRAPADCSFQKNLHLLIQKKKRR